MWSSLLLLERSAFPHDAPSKYESADKKEAVGQVIDKDWNFAVKSRVNLIVKGEVIVRAEIVHIEYWPKNNNGNRKQLVKRKLHYFFSLLLCW